MKQIKLRLSLALKEFSRLFNIKVMVFADDILVGTESMKNGFHLGFEISNTQPILVIKYSWRSQKLKIPKLEFGKNYEIIISYDRLLKGNFNSKPVKLITN